MTKIMLANLHLYFLSVTSHIKKKPFLQWKTLCGLIILVVYIKHSFMTKQNQYLLVGRNSNIASHSVATRRSTILLRLVATECEAMFRFTFLLVYELQTKPLSQRFSLRQVFSTDTVGQRFLLKKVKLPCSALGYAEIGVPLWPRIHDVLYCRLSKAESANRRYDGKSPWM